MGKETNMLSCDLAVIGAGVAGLTAAVQAAQDGLDVILLESRKRLGGNWNAVYGIMGVQSPISKKQGIDVNAQALVNQEIRLYNYQTDAKMWMDVANHSGEDIEWLMNFGVEFEDKLEPYTLGELNAPVFHKLKKSGDPAKKMADAFLKTGGRAMTETKAVRLIMEEGKVAGVVAEHDGKEIIIRCKAAIAAGGGYSKNKEMLKQTTGRDDCVCRGVGDSDGSSIRLCVEAGARSLWQSGTMVTDLIPVGMTIVNHWVSYIHSRPGTYPFHIFVNQDGERYVDEACSLKLFGFQTSAAYTQEKTFTIYDEQKLRKLQENNHNHVFDIMKNAADKGNEGIIRADSIEELAEKLGIDPAKLKKTVDDYNRYCETGKDLEYEKNPEFLQPIDQAPYYGWQNTYQLASTLRGVDYNRKMEVLSNDHKTIPGLYIAGTDGAKLWRGYYSLAIPASCMANNVYTGRFAAKNAAEYMRNVQ